MRFYLHHYNTTYGTTFNMYPNVCKKIFKCIFSKSYHVYNIVYNGIQQNKILTPACNSSYFIDDYCCIVMCSLRFMCLHFYSATIISLFYIKSYDTIKEFFFALLQPLLYLDYYYFMDYTCIIILLYLYRHFFYLRNC